MEHLQDEGVRSRRRRTAPRCPGIADSRHRSSPEMHLRKYKREVGQSLKGASLEYAMASACISSGVSIPATVRIGMSMSLARTPCAKFCNCCSI